MYFTIAKYQSFADDQGFPRLNEDSEHVYAKIINNKRRKSLQDNTLYPSFYIRTDPNKNIINPFYENSKKSFINKTCKGSINFSEVTESIFNKYINFLKTENPMWLSNAQREIR